MAAYDHNRRVYSPNSLPGRETIHRAYTGRDMDLDLPHRYLRSSWKAYNDRPLHRSPRAELGICGGKD